MAENGNEKRQDVQGVQSPNGQTKKHDGLFVQPVYEYKGTLLVQRNFDNMPNLEKFEFFPDDIVVATFPKSGTTWIQAIVTMILNNGDPQSLIGEYLESKWPYIDISGRKPGESPLHAAEVLPRPRTLKTHLPYDALPESFVKAGSKVIHVARNPKDTMVSMYYFVKSHRGLGYKLDFEDFVKHFAEDKIVYCPYFFNIASYWTRRHQPNVFFTTYEQLHKDPIGEVQRIGEFLGRPQSVEQAAQIVHHTTFDAMAANDKTNYSQSNQRGIIDFSISPFFRSGKIGTWKQHFTVAQNAFTDDWIAASLRKYHLEDINFQYQ